MKSSNLIRYLCRAAFILSSVLAAGIPAHGQGVPGYPDDVRYGFDPREVALLPRYCMYTQLFRQNIPGANNPDEVKRWTLLIGPIFNDMHHYCWGLMKTNRANLLARDQRTRMFYLRDSIQEFEYIINRVQPDFKLLPEILTKKGENLIQLDRASDGLLELERAIEIKSDYWPPYAVISDYYRKTGDVAKARKWLEEGLSVAPDVKALKRRMAELDVPEDKRKIAPQPPEKHSTP